MINEDIFNQQSRNTKQFINDDTINHLRIVNIDGFDIEETVKINNIQRELLLKSQKNNNSNEVGIMADNFIFPKSRDLTKTSLFNIMIKYLIVQIMAQ